MVFNSFLYSFFSAVLSHLFTPHLQTPSPSGVTYQIPSRTQRSHAWPPSAPSHSTQAVLRGSPACCRCLAVWLWMLSSWLDCFSADASCFLLPIFVWWWEQREKIKFKYGKCSVQEYVFHACRQFELKLVYSDIKIKHALPTWWEKHPTTFRWVTLSTTLFFQTFTTNITLLTTPQCLTETSLMCPFRVSLLNNLFLETSQENSVRFVLVDKLKAKIFL